MKILIIEDDKAVAIALKNGLQKDYIIDLAHTGRKGIFAALTNDYDSIILDLTLPDTTGFEVCQNLRQEGLTVPILILTGKDLTESKVVLLNAGADDYLVKPFSLAELKARLRAVLRRGDAQLSHNILTVSKLTLNLNTRTASLAGKPLILSRKEFLLLNFFMRQPNIPLSRLKLIEHIWEEHRGINSNTVDVHICNLRKKLGLTAEKPLIKTVHGTGYALIGDHANLPPTTKTNSSLPI